MDADSNDENENETNKGMSRNISCPLYLAALLFSCS